MIKDNEIKEKLAALKAGKLPLWDFYDWLEVASINMHRDSSNEAKDLVGSVKLLFADYDERVLDESELLNQILSLDEPIVQLISPKTESRFVAYEFAWEKPSRISWVGSASLALQVVQLRA